MQKYHKNLTLVISYCIFAKIKSILNQLKIAYRVKITLY
jgi:hypothetical protein